MSRPEVVIENHREVYQWYRTHGQVPSVAKFGHAAAYRLFSPIVSDSPGAAEAIYRHIASGHAMMMMPNHVKREDVMGVPAFMQCYGPLSPLIGGARIAAKEELFRGEQVLPRRYDAAIPLVRPIVRPSLDMLGAYPVFRSKSNKGVESSLQTAAAQGFVDTSSWFMDHGIALNIFGEAEVNYEQPDTVQRIRSGAERIVAQVATTTQVAIVPIGFSYSPDKQMYVHVGSPMIANSNPHLNDDIHEAIQLSVDASRDQWAA